MCDEKVNRCECINKSFEQLKAYPDFATAQTESRCGLECEGCVPYLKLMFDTGETAFDIVDPRLSAHQ